MDANEPEWTQFYRPARAWIGPNRSGRNGARGGFGSFGVRGLGGGHARDCNPATALVNGVHPNFTQFRPIPANYGQFHRRATGPPAMTPTPPTTPTLTHVPEAVNRDTFILAKGPPAPRRLHGATVDRKSRRVMKPKSKRPLSRRCSHCGQPFIVNPRVGKLHRYCPAPACVKVRQVVSGELKPTRNGRFENRGFLRVDFLQ